MSEGGIVPGVLRLDRSGRGTSGRDGSGRGCGGRDGSGRGCGGRGGCRDITV